MKLQEMAQLNNLEELVNIDEEVIGHNSRREYIMKAIEDERCIVAYDIKNQIVGFLLFDTHFFDCSFISLIIVRPTERRKGYATALIDYFINISPTRKIFSSTNKSNKSMQEVFKVNGFIESGFIENLDEGDPEIIYYRSR